MNGLRELPHCDRLSVLKLFLRPEMIVIGSMTTVGAMAGEPFAPQASPKLDLEVPLTILVGAFSPGESIFICLQR